MRRLRSQRLGIVVGALAGVVLTIAVLALVILLGDKDSKRQVSARSVPRGQVVYTLRSGDAARAPLSATRCEVSAEGGVRNLFCTRTPGGKYEIVFYSDSVLIFRVGDPDRPPRVVKWKP